ncbi:pentatricopeptide repeat-containing protein At5g57250, mitochondrial-like [Musa acuminata AAA Group]|uniref:pentatricopeptide repeat-containing protein At5g57250, mitochondrial-like n=1 Tax=Musa acuminata AAA Group TaxID=214697 RepID=UPI0031D662E8
MLQLSTPQRRIKAGLTAPSVRSFNLLLSFLLFEARKPRLVLCLFSQITSNSLPVDPRTHSLVARALVRSRRFHDAGRFISRAPLDFGFRRSLVESLIRRLCVAERNPDGALCLLQECVRNRGVFPSLGSFRSVVAAFCSLGRLDRAVEVLEAAADKKDRILTDNFVCSSIISGFSRIGEPALGLEFYERARKVDGFLPNLVTVTTVVDALCREGRINEACDLVRNMEDQGMALDAVLYSCLIDGYLKRGDLMEGLRKHKLMVDKGITPDVVSYTSIIDGLCKEGNVEKVIGFLEEMESKGAHANVVTFTAVIRGFCRRNKLEEAFHALRKVEELGFVADEFAYSVLIDGLCRKGDLDRVFSLLEELEKKEIKVGTVTYNTLINSLCKAGQASKANEISKGFAGDNFTYATLLHGYLKEMDVAGILEVKRRLDESGIVPDIVTCNVLIKALFMAGMIQDGCKLFDELPEMGLSANSITYCTVIDGYCKVGLIEKALMVFDECRRDSLFASASTHNCIIRGLCRQNMSEIAMEVFEDLVERNLSPDLITCRMLIRAIFGKGDGEAVLRFIHRMEKLEPELLVLICNEAIVFLCTKGCFSAALDVYILLRIRFLAVMSKSYNVLLKSLLRIGDKQIAELVISEFIKIYGTFEPQMTNAMFLYLSKKNVEKAIRFLNIKCISVGALTTVIDTLNKEGRVEDAYQFLLQSEENGVPVDVFVYSLVVDGLCKSGYLERALDLCGSMKKKGIYPNVVIYNSVINCLCQQGCLTEAFRVFDSLENLSVPPTVVTYSTLIGALSREGFLDDASQLFKRMISKGIIPNTPVFNKLITGYCNCGLVEEALDLLSDLEKNCSSPDDYTIAAILNGFCQRGDIEGALGFFTENKTRGCFPDFLGFMNLVEGLFAKGRMEEARSILRVMLQRAEIVDLINNAGDELHVESLDSLLSLACEQGRIKEVILVLNEISYLSISSARSDSGRVFLKLKELHGSGVVDTENKIDGRDDAHHLLSADVHGTNMKDGFREKVDGDNDKEINEYLTRKPLGYDFATYYSIISLLCQRGDLQKANEAARTILQNPEKVFNPSIPTL